MMLIAFLAMESDAQACQMGGMVKIQQTWQLGISYYVLGPRPVMYQCIIVNTIMDNRAGEACVTT